MSPATDRPVAPISRWQTLRRVRPRIATARALLDVARCAEADRGNRLVYATHASSLASWALGELTRVRQDQPVIDLAIVATDIMVTANRLARLLEPSARERLGLVETSPAEVIQLRRFRLRAVALRSVAANDRRRWRRKDPK